MESPLEKIQLSYNDELKVLTKKLLLKNNIVNKFLETIENIINKAVQPNPLSILKRHLDGDSHDKREKIIVQINQ